MTIHGRSVLCLAALLLLLLAAPALAAGPAGTWATSTGEGDYTLVERPNGAVEGTYPTDDGKIFGTLRGRQLTGYWVERSSNEACPTKRNGSVHWGTFVLNFNADWTEFRGTWGYCDETPQRGWSGSRLAPAPVKVVELRFVRKDGSPLSEIGYGEPFHVEARFDAPPPEAQRIVKLDWRGGAKDIPVIKQQDGKIFRSGLLYLEAPVRREQEVGEDGQRLPRLDDVLTP